MAGYNFKRIESKWQKKWEKSRIYEAEFPSKKKKWYSLFEFPYPSGDGLHVGHLRPYIGLDIISRKRRMEGYNVLFPIGWDAFGLPTENYAIKTGIHPEKVTKKNTDNFRRQIKSVGPSLDWSREINTTDPDYYKWTQWIFLKFFEHGLAYKANMPINWCPKDKIGLANEESVGGKCERCGTETIKKDKEQWMLKITAYAEKLLAGLKDVDYLETIKTQQVNWIGKSEGALIPFEIKNPWPGRQISLAGQANIKNGGVEVFTTRPDTLFGVTYVVLAPEHELISKLKTQISNLWEVEKYIAESKKKPEQERVVEGGEKTGVELKGVRAVNPANGKDVPVYVADYVLANYGTGVVMAVPAHDERDWEFARKFKLPVKMVICPNYPEPTCPPLTAAYTGGGRLVDSGKFNGMESEDAKQAITHFVAGKKEVKYKLRDWVFSRQRYWGEPIPLIFCENCASNPKLKDPWPGRQKSKLSLGEEMNPGWIPVADLPVKLPKVKDFRPGENGESPLASLEKWVKTKCPKCGKPARRETDVMPNWAGSSWYFLRYVDPKNKKEFANIKKLEYWMGAALPSRSSKSEGGVDWYNGGMEHVTLHLLYSRFWNQFLYDIGLVPHREPYRKRTAHGMILGEGGIKMSKSKGNVVNPDDMVNIYGADSLRLYEMFMGPFDQAIAWDSKNMEGVSRFLGRVWSFAVEKEITKDSVGGRLEPLINRTIKKVSEDIETMAFNTAVSSLMIFMNECRNEERIPQKVWARFLLLLAPFAPHIAEELWSMLKHKKSIHLEPWPTYDPELIHEETFELIVQVNGKVRAKVSVKRGISEVEAKELAMKAPGAAEYVARGIVKIVFVPNKLINFVVK